MSDNFKKMMPDGVAVPDLAKEPVKKAKKEVATAKEKALDRAARKLQDGKSLIQKPKHN